MKTRLEKFIVCDSCYSVNIINTSCVCCYGKHKTILLEFEVCECCGNLIEDGRPANTIFNENQIKKERE